MTDWTLIAVGVLMVVSFVSGCYVGASLTFKAARGINPLPLLFGKVSLKRFGRHPDAAVEEEEPDNGWTP